MSIQRIVIDSTNFRGELCELGVKFNADKSPYNTHPGLHKHPYTAVYQMLLAQYKHKAIDLCEIGLAGGSSAAMWLEYFQQGKFLFLDRDLNFLNNFAKLNPPRTSLKLVDVGQDLQLLRALGDTKYDVIIDDSSHVYEHQIRIVQEAFPSLKPGGVLIVEDIYRSEDEKKYENALKDTLKHCAFASFIITNHEDRVDTGWNNSKLLVLIKK